MNTETKICQGCRNQFTIDSADFDFYKKIDVPPPTWCPECRLQRRLLFMNERALYKRSCDLCGKSIVTMYAPESKLTVYCNPCWWSDKWDASEYAQDYDPSKSFLTQVIELYRRMPQRALEVNYPTLVNSDYINHAATAKNCYLIFTADECENVLYSEILLHNKDSMDGTIYSNSELCCGLINCDKCYRAFYSEDCEHSQEIYFSKDCNGCSHCFGCVGLRNKQYHIFNKPYSREEYEKKIVEFNVGSRKGAEIIKRRSHEFWKTFPHKYSHVLRNLNVTGDYVYESKNSRDMYIVQEGAEDCRYAQILTMGPTKDAYDYTIWGNDAQRMYEAMICGEGADTIKFSLQAWPNVRNIEYSMYVGSSSYMFGCADIRNKKYCILNKQYSETEYFELREKIIKSMNTNPYKDSLGRVYPYGEFFPSEFSPFGYNESYAADFFLLSRAEAESRGFSWYEAQPNPHIPTTKAADLPDDIAETKDEILNEIIECESCKKAFRIIPAELTLLRRFGFSVPHNCPTCRYKERLSRVNPPRLYHRKCECDGANSKNDTYRNTVTHIHGANPCPNEFETSYPLERSEVVYCENCYNSEVV